MKNILFISLLLLLMSCSKDGSENQAVNSQNFVGTWICARTTFSFEIKVGPGPTVTSFTEIPDPGYTTGNKFSVTSSSLAGDRLLFLARLENPFGIEDITEFTCTLVDKNTLKAIQVIRQDNVIIGSAELIYKRKT